MTEACPKTKQGKLTIGFAIFKELGGFGTVNTVELLTVFAASYECLLSCNAYTHDSDVAPAAQNRRPNTPTLYEGSDRNRW